jgi:hypothetical protein
MTDFPTPEPGPIQPDGPSPPGEEGSMPSDVPNTQPGRPDPFTGQPVTF